MSLPARNVAVLMGGQSSEHEVSLSSGQGVVRALDPERYHVTPVVILRDGRWRFGDGKPLGVFEAVAELGRRNPDCVFLALHGEYGEDGRIQGFLDLLGLPYTGSGCAASALAMDKVRSKVCVRAQGVRVAGHLALNAGTWTADTPAVLTAIRQDIGYPCVVKPSELGSSVAIETPDSEEALIPAMERVFQAADAIMVEEFVRGTEVTCGILEHEIGGPLRPLAVTEIRPTQGAFFDYHCKYTPGAAEEITPAPITPELTDQVQEISAHVHEILGCRLWSRSDFIIDENGPVWLEVNTAPGLTPTSLYPQAAAAEGISYAQLMAIFVEATVHAFHQGKGSRT